MPSEGRQSPPPERQTGAQLNDPPASGKGTDDATNKEQVNKEQLEVSFPSIMSQCFHLTIPRTFHPTPRDLLTML